MNVRDAMDIRFRGQGWREKDTEPMDGPIAGANEPDRLTMYLPCDGGLVATCGQSRADVAAGDGVIVAGTSPFLIVPGCTSMISVGMGMAQLDGLLPVAMPTRLARLQRTGGDTSRLTHLADILTSENLRLLKRLAYDIDTCGERPSFTVRGMMGDLILEVDERLTDVGSSAVKVADVLDYMSRNIAAVSLRSVAERFYCHPNTVANLVKTECGKTFSEVLTGMRMHHAQLLLTTSDIPVADVANSCGYRNMTHFYRLFNEHYGVSPAEYRRTFRMAG